MIDTHGNPVGCIECPECGAKIVAHVDEAGSSEVSEKLLDIRWLLGKADAAFCAGRHLEAWGFVDRARWKAGVPQLLPTERKEER